MRSGWLLLLATQAFAASPEPAPPPPAPVELAREQAQPRVAVWVQPFGLVALSVLSTQTGGYQVAWYVPLGLNAVVKDVEFVGELSAWGITGRGNVVGVTLAGGPLFHTGDERFQGVFVQPKLLVELVGDPLGFGGSVQVGVDVGAQYRWRALYLAFTVGASIGGGTGRNGFSGPLALTMPGAFENSASVGARLKYGLNLNLFRVGVAF